MSELLQKQVDPDYYLLDFSKEELTDVLIKSDEWSEFDVDLARELLHTRGELLDEETLKSERSKRKAILVAPDKNQTALIIVGYVFAFFGGFIGLIIGVTLYTSKKEIPDGTKVYRYSESNRRAGLNISLISGSLIALSFLLKILIFPSAE